MKKVMSNLDSHLEIALTTLCDSPSGISGEVVLRVFGLLILSCLHDKQAYALDGLEIGIFPFGNGFCEVEYLVIREIIEPYES